MRCPDRTPTAIVARCRLLASVVALALIAGGFATAQQPGKPKPAGAKQEPPEKGGKPEKAKKPAKPVEPDDEDDKGEKEKSFEELLAEAGLHPKKGPASCDLGPQATIAIPPDFLFLSRRDMPKFAQLTENLHNPDTLGAIAPHDGSWVLYISYEDSGHVSDSEKDTLDADGILASIKEGTDQANQHRRQQGWKTLDVVGWEKPPFYDPQTRNLTWAIRGRSDDGDNINYNSKILGRTGVTSLNLVVDPEHLPKTLPIYNFLVSKFAYKPDHGYHEFREGDKIAAYGLTALVAGGAVALAAKSGFLVKFGKFIFLGVIALFGGIASVFRKMFGGGRTTRY